MPQPSAKPQTKEIGKNCSLCSGLRAVGCTTRAWLLMEILGGKSVSCHPENTNLAHV